MEKVFTVEPGASVEDMVMDLGGGLCMDASESGNLVVETGVGEIRLTRPIACQEKRGRRLEAAAVYRLIGAGCSGFRVGSRDPNLAPRHRSSRTGYLPGQQFQ